MFKTYSCLRFSIAEQIVKSFLKGRRRVSKYQREIFVNGLLSDIYLNIKISSFCWQMYEWCFKVFQMFRGDVFLKLRKIKFVRVFRKIVMKLIFCKLFIRCCLKVSVIMKIWEHILFVVLWIIVINLVLCGSWFSGDRKSSLTN